ncbi:TOMM precursor leader peptide-binding protein [Paenibacillus sp.]|jgi:ribosomal protein S12 methylthiotransferase accessory factor|uniref:TOMM precursor leader peptide-binding protein n=1 Tax=Paenibacillus sp. TaxID=58172 RepID=UPI00281F15CA|nr:TOMM precursor leader peptide-binding protein [Paenibacillus sp.]MDR0268061.1 TOMM precursor leader peptide-binding protein [Paenibacillus sp.]
MNADILQNTVAIIGAGKLADFVHKQVQGIYSVCRKEEIPSELPKVRFALVLQDDWQPELLLKAEKLMRQSGIAWLCSFIMHTEAVVGPLIYPGVQGCSQCADYRLVTAGREREEILNSQMSFLLHGKIVRDQTLRDSEIRHIACLVSEETHRFMQERVPRLKEHIYVVNMHTLECERHRFLPNPTCEICGRLPEDTQQAAVPDFHASKKVDLNSYRCVPTDELEKGLMETYFSDKTGLFNRKIHAMNTIFADAGISLPSSFGDEVAGGRSFSFKFSETIAVLEGLERLCGMSPRGKKTSVFSSFNELGDLAMDPVSVGVYSEEQYSNPDMLYEPFDANLPIAWVWGYSFSKKCPILVPEQLAYYSGGSGFVHEFSNGCAIGGSLAEAIFYGILENVERDSFLITWYGQLPLPFLELKGSNDKYLRLMMERMSRIAGYEVHLFNSTMEHGIPSVWAIAKNKAKGKANLLCSAGAHKDIYRAAKSAIFELAVAIPRVEAGYMKNHKELVEMLHDPHKVQEMEEHSLLYSLPQAENRLSFLLDRKTSEPLANHPIRPAEIHDNMVDEMNDLVMKLLKQGLDVIVIDQTSPEIALKGLHCVKVLVPGMLPMTFGYDLTRLTGLDRVLRVPMELGFRTERLTQKELNPYPHPFL